MKRPNHQSCVRKAFATSLLMSCVGLSALFSSQRDSASQDKRFISRVLTLLDDDSSPPSSSGCCNETETSATTVETDLTQGIFDPQGMKRSQDALPCLVHQPLPILETQKAGADPSQTVMVHEAPVACGRLRRQWLNNPPLSDFAQQIQQHQANCTLQLANHHFDNTFGMGSHFVLWSQAVCNGMESGYRMRSHAPEWLWLDQHHCDMQQQAKASPLLCYFPGAESLCPAFDDLDNGKSPSDCVNKGGCNNITDPRNTKRWCSLTRTASPETRAAFRASSTEFLFHKLSPLVIQEAHRQVGVIFPDGLVPEDTVTVHIRWGDKFFEMDLPPIQEYIDAVQGLISNATTANIYLSTEDPRAYHEFMALKPRGWKVYMDITLTEIDAFRPKRGNRASWAARNTKGRAGLVALASLLVAMEAKLFVLTTKSNWSTLMNHLRMNILDPRCGNCTQMVDLRPGLW